MIKVAINGFGRIGRLVLRAWLEQKRQKKDTAFEIVAVNDLASVENCAHLFNYDSVHGTWQPLATTKDGSLQVDGFDIRFSAKAIPAQLPWRDWDISLVLECSGFFASKEGSMGHIKAGANRVLVSAPAKDADCTIVYGVNDDALKQSDQIVSNASCTTNCLATVAKIVDENFGIDYGTMTTIHSYTGDQSTVDRLHNDVRRARAAALSMIPTSTGAARAVSEVLPHLKGRIDGSAVRVPTPNVSLVDFVCTVKKSVSVKDLISAFGEAAAGPLHGILALNDIPLVSSDFNHSSVSATVDSHELRVMGEHMCRILAWYDNEWGFANRMVDVANVMAQQ